MITALKTKNPFYVIGDILTISIAFFISSYYIWKDKFSIFEATVLLGFILFWFLLKYWRKEHFSKMNYELRQSILNHIKIYLAFLIPVLLFYLLFPIPHVRRLAVIAIVLVISVIDIVINYLYLKLKSWAESKEGLKHTLVAGTGSVAKNVAEQLYANQVTGYQIKGFINCKKNEQCVVGPEKVVSDLKGIQQYLKENTVDEIVIALPVKHTKKILNIISAADYHGIRVKYVLDYQEVFGKNYKITRFGKMDAFNVCQLPIECGFFSFIKSCFDKVFSATVLILLSPLFLTLAILIKLDSPGPVFYCPVRIGRGCKPFKVFKFRSMSGTDASSGGTLSTQKADPRVTKIGKVLRKYSLDELPQFMNVLLGQMSVVGPRPHRKFLNQQLQESVNKYMVRHYVKPGITGWAQVNGWRGPTDTDEQKKQRTLHDLWYIENWSLYLDLKIIFQTIFGKKVHSNAF